MFSVPRRGRALAAGAIGGGLVAGLLVSPATAAVTGVGSGAGGVTSAAATTGATETAHGAKSKRSGSAKLAIGLERVGQSQYIVADTLSRIWLTGVIKRQGRVVRRIRVLPNARRSTVVRGLAPGRYVVRMRRVHARTDVPGATVPSLPVSATRALRQVRVRTDRTVTWRAAYRASEDFSLVVTGILRDPDGSPIVGLPVCSLTVTRFSRSRRCGSSGADGRFAIRLHPSSDVYVNWEWLEFGDDLQDLPWRTVTLPPSEISDTVHVLQPRGWVTGVVTDGTGGGVADRSICAAPWEYLGGGSGRFRVERAWCATTDATGRYSLRVDGGEYLLVPGNPTSKGFIELMDSYLGGDSETVETDDSGRLMRWDIGVPPDSSPGCATYGSCSAAPYVDMIARPGRQFDFALTDLLPGDDFQVSGRVTRIAPEGQSAPVVAAGHEVCAFSRAGFACTLTDATGRYAVSLPTRVSPSNPRGSQAIKVVTPAGYPAGLPAVARRTELPGADITVDLDLRP